MKKAYYFFGVLLVIGLFSVSGLQLSNSYAIGGYTHCWQCLYYPQIGLHCSMDYMGKTGCEMVTETYCRLTGVDCAVVID